MTKVQLEMPVQIISPVFGKLDNNIFTIEKAFNVKITTREGYINIVGEQAKKAEMAIAKLIDLANNKEEINMQNVNYIIHSIDKDYFPQIDKLGENLLCLAANGKPIAPKTVNQQKYIKHIQNNTIVFGVGPAGTGKTFLAMAMAVTLFKTGEISRIVLTRPAIEAGESLGFLPGDLQQKIDPYLRPLYDALNEIMGQESFQKNKEKGLIEVAPLAYMRGRTLNNSFIVLDEAQNTTPEQMKMFLTRIGFGSKAVVTGDITQIDLPANKTSGLVEAAELLTGIDDIGIMYLKKEDVVRHPLVQKIINAYEKKQKKELYKNKNPKTRFK